MASTLTTEMKEEKMSVLFGLMFVIGLIFLAEGLTKKLWLTKMTDLFWNFLIWPFTHDIILGPISWFVIQVGLAFGVARVIAELLDVGGAWAANQNYLVQNPFAGMLGTGIWLAFTVIFLLPRWKKDVIGEGDDQATKWKLAMFKVPAPEKGAQLSWLGMLTSIVLKSGDYPLLGEIFGFAWLPVEPTMVNNIVTPRTIADKEGYLILGDIIFQVWQSPTPKTTEEKTSITLQAGNGATVTGNFSIVLRGVRRINWAKASDSGLQVGNRCRQELQEVIERFVDTDVKSIQGDMPRLIRGDTMKTVFLPKAFAGNKERSIIRDKNGKPITVFVKDYKTEADADAALQTLLKNTGDEASIKTLTKDASANILLASVRVTAPITELIRERGFELDDVIYDSVRASSQVEVASNVASAEARQRESQLANARSLKEASKLNKPTPAELKNLEAWQFGKVLAAAIDPGNTSGVVRVTAITGGNDLTRSVVAANQVTEDTKK